MSANKKIIPVRFSNTWGRIVFARLHVSRRSFLLPDDTWITPIIQIDSKNEADTQKCHRLFMRTDTKSIHIKIIITTLFGEISQELHLSTKCRTFQGRFSFQRDSQQKVGFDTKKLTQSVAVLTEPKNNLFENFHVRQWVEREREREREASRERERG